MIKDISKKKKHINKSQKNRLDHLQNDIESAEKVYLPVLVQDTSPMIPSQEWLTWGRLAEWMAVHEGKTPDQIAKTGSLGVSKSTLDSWSTQHRWPEKRKRFAAKDSTVQGMIYDLLYTKLIAITQQQLELGDLETVDIVNLERLVRMFKQTGVPFIDQVSTVMKSFLRYIDKETEKGSAEQLKYLAFIRDYVVDVENGFVHLDDR